MEKEGEEIWRGRISNKYYNLSMWASPTLQTNQLLMCVREEFLVNSSMAPSTIPPPSGVSAAAIMWAQLQLPQSLPGGWRCSRWETAADKDEEGGGGGDDDGIEEAIMEKVNERMEEIMDNTAAAMGDKDQGKTVAAVKVLWGKGNMLSLSKKNTSSKSTQQQQR